MVQELSVKSENVSPIWIVRFSHDGKFLASGANDGSLSLWKLDISRSQQTETAPKESAKTGLVSLLRGKRKTDKTNEESDSKSWSRGVFANTPSLVFRDHTMAVTDISWSKGGFLLSASLDFSVRLYHIEHQTCLCTFRHAAPVTCVRFHPIDERLFTCGTLDGKILQWSIESKKVLSWNSVEKASITALAHTLDGNTVIVGTSNGSCVFYDALGLKYSTQIQVTGSKLVQREVKITGIEALPNKLEDRILITAADSRLRLVNVRDRSLVRKYRGHELRSGRSFASFSEDSLYIVVASEDKHVYVWDTQPKNNNQQFSGMLSGVMQWQSDNAKSGFHERVIHSHDALTLAVFAPWTRDSLEGNPDFGEKGQFIVTADVNGKLRVYENIQT
ncbi:WD40-repeat-containing domain protein [Gorgonomyces haynaldii]|nr:WD40-repeat-containing domain protein [Gorgonomyces haynaldii]